MKLGEKECQLIVAKGKVIGQQVTLYWITLVEDERFFQIIGTWPTGDAATEAAILKVAKSMKSTQIKKVDAK